MIVGIICVITGLSVWNSVTGHGVRNNPNLNPIVVASGTSTNETGTGNVVDCYSSSSFSPGDRYWNCGFCRFYDNRRGTGNSRTCRASQ